MRDYMEFAWGKADDHRGLSAMRSVEKFKAWVWLLGNDKLVEFCEDDDHYAYYGAPVLQRICQEYSFPIPDDAGIQRMMKGLPCKDGCTSGCNG
jgi:hypothetical protein